MKKYLIRDVEYVLLKNGSVLQVNVNPLTHEYTYTKRLDIFTTTQEPLNLSLVERFIHDGELYYNFDDGQVYLNGKVVNFIEEID